MTSRALTSASAVCVIQKHVAALFVPGVPGVSRISASARSAQVRPSRRSVEATALPTTTSVNSACPPACRRGELMWRSPAAVMKVGNGLRNGVIMLTNWPLKWRNYLYQATCVTLFIHLWILIMATIPPAACQRANTGRGGVKVTPRVQQQNLLHTNEPVMNTNECWVITFRPTF